MSVAVGKELSRAHNFMESFRLLHTERVSIIQVVPPPQLGLHSGHGCLTWRSLGEGEVGWFALAWLLGFLLYWAWRSYWPAGSEGAIVQHVRPYAPRRFIPPMAKICIF